MPRLQKSKNAAPKFFFLQFNTLTGFWPACPSKGSFPSANLSVWLFFLQNEFNVCVCVLCSGNIPHYSLQRLIVIDQDPVATAGLSLPLVGVQAPRSSTDVPAQPRRLHRLLHLRAWAAVHGDARPGEAQVYLSRIVRHHKQWKLWPGHAFRSYPNTFFWVFRNPQLLE